MKKKSKWFAITSLLILAVICIDINMINYKYLSVNEDILDIINSATLSIVLIIVIRFINKKTVKQK